MSIKVSDVLLVAKQAKASDVHLTVQLPPMMRVNGHLVRMEQFPVLTPDDTLELMLSITNDHQREIFNSKGELDMSFAVDPIGRYRVNAFRQRGSVALALRTVNTVVPSPEQLGLPQAFVDLYTRKRGLILVTGPTGSGKSTSLASVINMVNEHRDAHIITLEDPIEYLHLHKTSMVNQREIGFDSMTYANALRAALREDPDVILVGEMRDFETISVAITAAETGHLVLSTLHTIGAASTVDRIIDVFPPHQQQQIRVQLANVLEAVISQQLIPTADGQGRAAAFEVMIANSAVRALIREGKSHQLLSVMQTNRKLGMIAMDEAITALFQEGKITRDMAIQYAVDPDGMAQKLR
ncbi:MAG: type IV pilus twitching motility protein PilT [Lachnospiraceae bacterium]|jgi:twitching motility protein PilT|nr:type IV pilus twitching motility protein PilT [Lachnospiraceae bacterium]MBR4183862.1 type IV pilus twitching motility protein PilT [Lachnospiraceae bacterium]MBR4543358.1 type IV pilus twitching motility protein PilT [Lachnospiraceae bacterium]MCR5011420.1 type IV pilus twitching motility protein PilT [Lachnospiraceae bacterium]